jgi:hypothetical protein
LTLPGYPVSNRCSLRRPCQPRSRFSLITAYGRTLSRKLCHDAPYLPDATDHTRSACRTWTCIHGSHVRWTWAVSARARGGTRVAAWQQTLHTRSTCYKLCALASQRGNMSVVGESNSTLRSTRCTRSCVQWARWHRGCSGQVGLVRAYRLDYKVDEAKRF